MMPTREPSFKKEQVIRLWLHCQGLLELDTAHRSGANHLTKTRFRQHLRSSGGLQVDTINVVDRAHYLTLWSRFGSYDRALVDSWIYRDKVAYEYWGHEASILPIEHLPVSRRRMKQFPPPSWRSKSWWDQYRTSPASKRRVLKGIRTKGPLDSTCFERSANDRTASGDDWWSGSRPKEDKRSLQLLWHQGRLAVCGREHFRRIYDLAERHYPDVEPVSGAAYRNSWLFSGLRGCGIAHEQHLVNYFTAPELDAAQRKRIIASNLRSKHVLQVRVSGFDRPFMVLPEYIDIIDSLPKPRGTTLICPFDSLLWQRGRARELFDFDYRVEIYVPENKRRFGYYVMPIFHAGRPVGRLDPKLHRIGQNSKVQRIEIKRIALDPGFQRNEAFDHGFRSALESLAAFVGATQIDLPRGWRRFM